MEAGRPILFQVAGANECLNPKSKLTLERGTNLINRNTRAC